MRPHQDWPMRPQQHARRALLVALLAMSLGAIQALPAWGAEGDMHEHGRYGLMWGNMNEYPDLASAGERNVAKARRLLKRSRASAPRLASVAQARRAGYAFEHAPNRPGFTHMRKNGTRYWGRFLDPVNPQALVVWCPSAGPCKTAAYMYRARPGRAPSSWGDIFSWHRHAKTSTASWMTHVWLVPQARRAYASCAPMPYLARALGIMVEPFSPDVHADRPCTGAPPGDAPPAHHH